ncbi:MAG: hypothetical protein JWP89_2097 [Schlesneria sp.]|nr:hypothetical protein [Schlesneria sp.]
MVLHRFFLSSMLLLLCGIANADEASHVVDAKTMHHKVMCGYQGWFRCAGDSSGQGWRHWSRDGRNLNSKTVTVEMWPDLAGFDDDEKYPATGFTDADGNPAQLFSSVHPKTVDRHFQWMQQYGIDGVFLQRFLAELNGPSLNQVLANVRQSANKSGRAFGICYDLSGMSKDKLFDTLVADWKKLVDEQQVTRDPRYLHHNNKPILFIWGFYSDRFGPELAERIVDFFKNDPKYGVTLIGGCEWWWRTEKNPEWSKVFRKFDIISPWNPGNSTTINGERHAATGSWKEDLAEAKRAGMEYLPVVYPGFGWTNLVGEKGTKNDLPRLKGEFYWRQFSTAADLGIDMAYVAMFDEVDEATAIFKVTNSPPRPGHFVTYEGLPSDWYLRLTGEGTKLIRGERQNQITIPIKP